METSNIIQHQIKEWDVQILSLNYNGLQTASFCDQEILSNLLQVLLHLQRLLVHTCPKTAPKYQEQIQQGPPSTKTISNAEDTAEYNVSFSIPSYSCIHRLGEMHIGKERKPPNFRQPKNRRSSLCSFLLIKHC